MKYDVYGLGNALVDMEFHVSDKFFADNEIEKGTMTLVEEDRQNFLMDKLKSASQSELKRQCGGSAANTVIAVSQFGGKSFYSCKVSNDETGKFYLNDLGNNGVDTKLTAESTPEGTTGKCMVMVTDDAERTMNTYLGITASFGPEQLDQEAIGQSKWLYVEGYLVASPTGQEAALEALSIAREKNVKTAITMSDPNMVKFFKDNFNQLLTNKVDLLFCNEIEAFEFAGTDDLAEAREKLKEVAATFVITLGKEGALVWDGNNFITVESHNVDAIDSNGAGDMYAGAFMYGITNGSDYTKSAKFASLAASKVVSQYGPRLSSEQALKIKEQGFGA